MYERKAEVSDAYSKAVASAVKPETEHVPNRIAHLIINTL
jgi:hypothetical protein